MAVVTNRSNPQKRSDNWFLWICLAAAFILAVEFIVGTLWHALVG